ncbi:MAG: regulatory protein RecX [Janthinobacterium lividum]
MGAAGPDPDADPEEVARGIVLRKLAVQARTRVELERALAGRDVPEEVAGAVLDRMTEVGLVDDVTFAHDWVSSRQQRRHLSKTALRRELQTKGVDRDVIDDALADVEGADEHSAALDLAQRRAATMGGLAREVAYRRLGGVLARRGFSSSVTTRVLSEVLDGFGRDD